MLPPMALRMPMSFVFAMTVVWRIDEDEEAG